MSAPATMRVIAWAPASQGPYVVINVQDFDPALHTPFEDVPQDGGQAAPAATEAPKRRGRPPRTQPPES